MFIDKEEIKELNSGIVTKCIDSIIIYEDGK